MNGSIERYSRISITRSTADGTVHTELQFAQISVDDGEWFDPEACCDEREKALIAELRAYLRPEEAPECLLRRLRATLDQCCREDQARQLP